MRGNDAVPIAARTTEEDMKRIRINSAWVLTGDRIEGELSATVPGCVHADLRRAGLIPDPYYRDNNRSLGWIEQGNYTYRTTFTAAADAGARLCFEGLDTYADIYLNGRHIGESHNMFVPHAYPVGDVLREGENLLEVRFRSPIREVEGMRGHTGAFTTERMNTRRIQCTYSWDWVDRFVTVGIFLPVYIEYPNGPYATDAYIYTSHIDREGAEIVTELEFDCMGGGALALVEVISPDGATVASTKFYADHERYIRRFNIDNPRLWWPAGYGEGEGNGTTPSGKNAENDTASAGEKNAPSTAENCSTHAKNTAENCTKSAGERPLYTLRVTVGENTLEKRFGIRTLRIVERVDEVGSEYHCLAEKMAKTRHGSAMSHNERHSGFLLLVNGEPIFCKGGNWVPCEPLLSEESDEKITKLVKMAREMGANMLRVWGGGYFERDSLYDACDREGILVLQDFLMACGQYPEDEEWFIDELKTEAEHAVRRLRNHPSLAWWHGDNENATAGSDTQENYTGRRSALDGLAGAVTTLDHTRRFLPSSPYGGNTYGCVDVGTTHTTNFLGDIFAYFDSSDCRDYKEYLGGFTARFISEEGVFGGVSTPSLLRFMTAADLDDPTEAMLLYHTKGNPALPKEIFEYVTSFAKKALGEPKTTAERLFKYKYAQYEWVRLAFENARRRIGYTNGLLFWMFNDCWPAALGWAFVDYYTLPKASYYAFRRLARPVTASVTEEGGEYLLHISTENATAGGAEYTAYQFDLGDMSSPVGVLTGYVGDVDPRTSVSVPLPFTPDPHSVIYVDITHDGGTDRAFFKAERLTLAPTDALEYSVNGDTLTVTARTTIHAVEIEGDLIPEDNYFTLLPGESRTLCLKNGGVAPIGYPLTVRGFTVVP